MKKKYRFGGMSFGGILGGGTTIFSKRYKLNIYKDMKTKEWKQEIKKKRLPINIHFLFLLFPFIDGVFYITEFKPYIFSGIGIAIGKFIFGDITKQEAIDMLQPIVSIPSWVWDVLTCGCLIFALLFCYFFFIKGIRRWHGCEHKVIEAAINDDIDNAIKYNPVSDGCGGTYMLSLYLGVGLYMLISSFVFNMFVPVGIYTFILVLIILESKFYHKYNKLGIWFGRVLQRNVTVSEPFNWQLNLGIDGMIKLIDVEYNGKKP